MKEYGNRDRDKVGLPVRPFLYTLDQIAQLIQTSLPILKKSYVHFEGRTTGAANRDMIRARNIAPTDQPPEWRVTEVELIRWFKRKGFRIYERRAVAEGNKRSTE